ncbi:hypothetical protein [Myceligenerans pegani]|uniref:Uncharacterized protein n=1 Tax=Myceligenerans pegani TaxID=2776917 RepID=A0ABR9MW08_9MICO|nr:hypothetical protein [Myceligenerans sp. TRM 65318]MBE1875562.1 hypothetical protein [Myceligenerans sp. TRM 65318]MBE3017833.1 hypothetical protein [Myceligenerans sp. TRM 65318]
MSEHLWGQDIEQVRELSGRFAESAGRLEAARHLVDGVVSGFDGWGANVDQMRDLWSGDLAPSLTQAADALRGAGDTAARNADEQEGTTEAYGGSPFAGVTASGSVQAESPFAGASATGPIQVDDGGVFDWFGDRLDDVGDGVVRVGDQVSDGAGWVSDRATDLGDWFTDTASDVGSWVSETATTLGDGYGNLGDAGGQLWDATGGSILDGEWPRTTEVIASGVLFGGALIDTSLTTGTAGLVDLNLFDDGEPYAGDPQPVRDDELTVPYGIEDLAGGVKDAYDAGDGTVRVTTIETEDGPRVIVSVPGTEAWSPAAGDNAMDLTGNLVTAGGGTSTMTEAVELAMQNADIPPDAQVMLVGHSQGGMTVADLVSDSDFVSEYNVTNAMVFGSPIDSDHVDPGVNMLEVQHEYDVVPRLDMGDGLFNPLAPLVPFPSGTEQAGANHTEVTLDNPGPIYDAGQSHGTGDYDTSLGSSTDPGLLAYEEHLRDSGFLFDPATLPNDDAAVGNASSTSAVDIGVGRRS